MIKNLDKLKLINDELLSSMESFSKEINEFLEIQRNTFSKIKDEEKNLEIKSLKKKFLNN